MILLGIKKIHSILKNVHIFTLTAFPNCLYAILLSLCILYESGKDCNRAQQTEPKSEVEQETQTEAKSEVEQEQQTQTEPKNEVKQEQETQTEAKSEVEQEQETQTEPKNEVKQEQEIIYKIITTNRIAETKNEETNRTA